MALLWTVAGVIVGGLIVYLFLSRKDRGEIPEELLAKLTAINRPKVPLKELREVKAEYEKLRQEMATYKKLAFVMAEKYPSVKLSEPFKNMVKVWKAIDNLKGEMDSYPYENFGEYFKEKIEHFRSLMKKEFSHLAQQVKALKEGKSWEKAQ